MTSGDYLNCLKWRTSMSTFLDSGLLLTMKLLNQEFPLVNFKSSLQCVTVATMTCLIVTEYLCHKCPRICSRSIPHSWLITVFVARSTRRVPLMEQELLALPKHLSSHPVYSGVHVARSLVLCVMFCRSLFVLLYFFCWPCVVCSVRFTDSDYLPLITSNYFYSRLIK